VILVVAPDVESGVFVSQPLFAIFVKHCSSK